MTTTAATEMIGHNIRVRHINGFSHEALLLTVIGGSAWVEFKDREFYNPVQKVNISDIEVGSCI